MIAQNGWLGLGVSLGAVLVVEWPREAAADERVETALDATVFVTSLAAPLAIGAGAAAARTEQPFVCKGGEALGGAMLSVPGAILIEAGSPAHGTGNLGWNIVFMAAGVAWSSVLGGLGTWAVARGAGDTEGSYGAAVGGAALGSVLGVATNLIFRDDGRRHSAARSGLTIGMSGGGAVLLS